VTALLLKILDWLATAWSGLSRVRVRTHIASLLDDDQASVFINVTNHSSRRELEITHVWLETTPSVDVVNTQRPLPKRLQPDESWETWIPITAVPSSYLAEVLRLARVRFSSGRVVKARPNLAVRPIGYIPGASN
jgi:hypothetical protein